MTRRMHTNDDVHFHNTTRNIWQIFPWGNHTSKLSYEYKITCTNVRCYSLSQNVTYITIWNKPQLWPWKTRKDSLNSRKDLTHWGRVTHICVGKLTIIGSDNGLPPVRRQAIIWTNAGILLIRPSGTNFSEILIEIDVIPFKKMIWKCRLRNGIQLSRPPWVKHRMIILSASKRHDSAQTYNSLWVIKHQKINIVLPF